MRIETFCDLSAAWDACAGWLSKIFFFPFLFIGWCMLFIVSVYLNAITELGEVLTFLQFDDDEKDES